MKMPLAAMLTVVLAIAPRVFAQRYTVVCPTIPAPPASAGEYAKVAVPDTPPARCFFCGKVNKHKSDGTISDCNAGSPCPFIWPDPANASYVKCGNLIDPPWGGNATLMGGSALESAEIRGWIVHGGFPHIGESEFEWDILLDIG